MTDWTHKYRYVMKSNRYIDRVGTIFTGTIQACKECSDKEIEILAKEMAHGTLNDAKIIETRLITLRN